RSGGNKFTLKRKGFGILGSGTLYYIPNSVQLLLQYLGRRRIQDDWYISTLARAAADCGRFYLSGGLSLQTEFQIVSNILISIKKEVEQSLGKSDPSLLDEMSCRRLAENGDLRAQAEVGQRCYSRGNYDEAVFWYTKAANQDYPDGLRLLGDMYRLGQCVSRDLSRAADLYRKGAEMGDAWCQCNLAVSYANGDGVPQDYQAAFNWYRKAADQGLAEAQDWLGMMYYKGEGVTQDFVEAAKR